MIVFPHDEDDQGVEVFCWTAWLFLDQEAEWTGWL